MAYNTYGKQSDDDNNWGYALLQQPHAQESQQQRSQTWNQSIQVILQVVTLIGSKDIPEATCWKAILMPSPPAGS